MDGATVAAPRNIRTNNYDLTSCGGTGGTVCFELKFGVQGAASPCEGIDLPAEGVYVQYSTNNGGAWTTLQYFDINTDPGLTNWKRYCINIPAGAMTTSTTFRWYQGSSSGAGFDAWGLDNMVITLNAPGYTYDWVRRCAARANVHRGYC